jgi:hypothetical protein
MKQKRNWAIGIILTATAGYIALQSGLAPSSAVTETPPITSTSIEEPCAYVPAYQDSPKLALKIETAIRALDPNAVIKTQVYGENCVYSNGSVTFSAMETDLYIHTSVDDLNNEEAFGNWMAQVLPVIVQIPETEFPGGYGFVQFLFEKNNGESVAVKVQISRYFDTEVQSKTGIELFHLFYNQP